MNARGFDYYLDKYALSNYGVKFADLSERQRGAIYYKILQKAGGGNVQVTVEVRRLQVLARVLIVFSAMLAAGEIALSDQKLKELSRQGSILAGGLLGGYVGGGCQHRLFVARQNLYVRPLLSLLEAGLAGVLPKNWIPCIRKNPKSLCSG